MGTTDPVLADLARYEAEQEAAEDAAKRVLDLRAALADDINERGLAGLDRSERDLVLNGDNDLILMVTGMGEALIGNDAEAAQALRGKWIERAAGLLAEKRMDAASRRLA